MTLIRTLLIASLAFFLSSKSSAQTIETCFRSTSNDAIYACTLEIKRHQKSPNIGGLYSRRGSLWLMRAMYEEAISDFKEATRLNSEDIDAWIGLGSANLQLGHEREAIANLTEALRLDPSNKQARDWLDIAYAMRVRR